MSQARKRGEIVRVADVPRPRPMSGAAAPACVVEKNRGSISAKSPSARMRSTSTEPTMPRQPIRPDLGFVAIATRLLHCKERTISCRRGSKQ